jgi:hypothetical protein
VPRREVWTAALRSPFVTLLFLTLLPGQARGQVVVRVNDDVSFRFGTLLHFWADWTQDPVSGGYAQNFFIRRIRFLVVATLSPNVTAFYQTEDSRLGNAGLTGTKSLTTGFQSQDALVEWRLAKDKIMIDAGLFYTPQSRSVLTGSPSALTFDIPSFGQQQGSVTGSSAGRDIGFALKGYLLEDRLEYRAGVFEGQRRGAAAAPGSGASSRNSPRAAARLQYDFLDKEKGYTYVGTNRGGKSILAVGAWGDTQGDYRAYGFDVFADIPIGKNAVTAETDYLLYDGGKQFQQVVGGVVVPLLPREEALFAEAGFYFDTIKLQPFLRYEWLGFSEERFRTGNQQRYGGGLNWYLAGQNLKVTAFYERIVPKVKPVAATIRATNHAGIQIQFYYF